MSTWVAGAYIDALGAALQARPGLAAVQVCTAPIPKDRVQREAIAVVGIRPSQEEPAAIGPRAGGRATADVSVIQGAVQVQVLGSGEADAVTCRQRCLAIFDEVETTIREDYDLGLNEGEVGSNQVISAVISSKSLDQGVVDKYRVCSVAFDIRLETRS